MNVFVDNLRRLRQTRGYTQEELANQLGVSAQTVSRWECGTTLPDVMQLPKLAHIYGITVDDLYREPINAYPNYAQRLVAVYEATGRTEDFLAAEQEYIRLLTRAHTADDLRSFGVLYHYMMKRCASRAEEYLDAAMAKSERTDPVYSSAAQQKIVLMRDLGRGDEAVAQYDRLLERSADLPISWLLCIAAHYYAEDAERAYEIVCEAIRRFPENAALRIYAGDICRKLKRYEEAFPYWQKALELDSGHVDAVFSMGFCYEECGRYGEAFRVWTDLHRELLRRGFVHECELPAKRAKFCGERIT